MPGPAALPGGGGPGLGRLLAGHPRRGRGATAPATPAPDQVTRHRYGHVSARSGSAGGGGRGGGGRRRSTEGSRGKAGWGSKSESGEGKDGAAKRREWRLGGERLGRLRKAAPQITDVPKAAGSPLIGLYC